MSTTVIRAGLAVLALSAAYLGLWAVLAPQSFFDNFPGGGFRFVESLPPYNEHLVRDFGAMNLSMAFVLAAAAYTMSRTLITVALLATLINAVPHFIFHAGHQGSLSDSDQIASLIGLAFPIVVSALLLGLLWTQPDGDASPQT